MNTLVVNEVVAGMTPRSTISEFGTHLTIPLKLLESVRQPVSTTHSGAVVVRNSLKSRIQSLKLGSE